MECQIVRSEKHQSGEISKNLIIIITIIIGLLVLVGVTFSHDEINHSGSKANQPVILPPTPDTSTTQLTTNKMQWSHGSGGFVYTNLVTAKEADNFFLFMDIHGWDKSDQNVGCNKIHGKFVLSIPQPYGFENDPDSAQNALQMAKELSYWALNQERNLEIHMCDPSGKILIAATPDKAVILK